MTRAGEGGAELCVYAEVDGGRCALAATADSPPPERVQMVVLARENERLRSIIRRALRELDVPAFYGEGSVWNDMLEAVDG